MNHKVRFAGHGAILLCAVLWSTSGLFIKLMTWHPMVIAGSRSFLAVFILLLVRMRQEKSQKLLPNPVSAKEFSRHFIWAVGCGFWYAATMILFVFANRLTFAANAILLQYTAPIWACLLGWYLLKEKPHWEHWVALALVCFGMLLFFSNGLAGNFAANAGGSPLGDLLALLSGITFAVNTVILRKHKEGNPLDIMIYAHILCLTFSAPFFFIYPPELNAPNILPILFMGIFQIGVASALFVYGIKRVRAVQAMLTAAIEPVLNPVWVLLVIGEKPALSVIAGGILIVSAVVFSSFVTRRREISIST